VKPDIVFFGENLPSRFSEMMDVDLREENCDLLLIMGTSLQVAPFCNLASMVSPRTPRLLINMELVGMEGFSMFSPNLLFHDLTNYRDVALLGPSDDSIEKLSAYLGWEGELRRMVDEVCFNQGSTGSSSEHWLKGLRFEEGGEEDAGLDFDWRRGGSDEEEEEEDEEGDILETQTSVPSIDQMHKYRGQADGQLSLFKDRMGESLVYRWVEEEDGWVPLDTPNNVSRSQKKTLFNGKLVDLVLPVIIESASRGILEFEMGLNHTDDTEEVAVAFCKEHDLNEYEYKGQIVDFLAMVKSSV
jgi:hypothetical protein